jgi:hypothetical protein
MKDSIRILRMGAPIVGAALRAGGVAAVMGLMTLIPIDVEAQGRGNSRGKAETSVGVTRPGSTAALVRSAALAVLSVDSRSYIREYYSSRPYSQVASLPPGIRRNLARGKPLPPGIAKRFASTNLSQRVRVPQGYQLMEMGRDVLLVNVATNLIHDILRDVVR